MNLVSWWEHNILSNSLSWNEITEQDVLVLLDVPVITEIVLLNGMGSFSELLSVLFVDETISEDSESLAHEELSEVLFGLDVLETAHQHTLNNLGKITKVESVMGLGWSWQEELNCLGVDLDGRRDDLISFVSEVTSFILFLAHISFEDGREDASH